MSSSRIHFDELTDRWELSVGASVVGAIEEHEPGLHVARDEAGTVVLALVDREAVDGLSPDSRRLIDDAFGPGAMDSLVADNRVESLRVSVRAVPLIDGEPGMPHEVEPNTYVVPIDGAPVTVSLRGHSIEVVVPSGSNGSWVRVSLADSGLMIALGPVRSERERRRSSISFGLDTPVDELHFHVTDTPLETVPNRFARRRRWLGQLLSTSWRSTLLRPIRSMRTARRAAAVSNAIDDHDGLVAAQRNLRLSWMSVLLRALMMTTVVVAVVAGVTRSNSAPPEGVIRLASSDSARYEFVDGSSVDVRVIRNGDGSEALLVTESVMSTAGFGRDPRLPNEPLDEDRYRQVCLENTEMDVSARNDYSSVTTPFEVYFVDTAIAPAEGAKPPVLWFREVEERRPVHQSVDPQACRDGTSNIDGVFDVPATLTLEQVEIRLDGLVGATKESGRWRLSIVRPGRNGEVMVGESDGPIVLAIS